MITPYKIEMKSAIKMEMCFISRQYYLLHTATAKRSEKDEQPKRQTNKFFWASSFVIKYNFFIPTFIMLKMKR